MLLNALTLLLPLSAATHPAIPTPEALVCVAFSFLSAGTKHQRGCAGGTTP